MTRVKRLLIGAGVAITVVVLAVGVAMMGVLAAVGDGPVPSENVDGTTEIADIEFTVADEEVRVGSVTVEGDDLPDLTIEERTYTIDDATVEVDGVSASLGDRSYEVGGVTVHLEDVTVHVEGVVVGEG